MKNQKKLILFLSFVIVNIINIYPQPGNSIIGDIDDAIKSSFGTNFNLQDVKTVDSSYQYSNWGLPLFDPYGTLNSSYIFIALKDKDENSQVNVGVLGVYKYGQIVWDSDPMIYVEDLNDAEIISILDLNKDGEVDIVTAWPKWVSADFSDIWIYSWNGVDGSLISELDQDNQSAITGFDIVLLDRDGDGILELCGNAGCYSWNGSLYGKWDSDPLPEFVPKDRLNAAVKCIVDEELNGFKYRYNILNNLNSIQQIEQFGIDAESENISYFTKPDSWDFYYIAEEYFISSEILPPLDSHPSALINPREEKGEYTFISSGLPKINSIYIQGYNGERDFDIQNIKSNSFVTQTLAPNDPPDSLDAESFIDSLISYISPSLTLVWIANQTTADKYDSLFTLAKTQLQQSNNNAARTTLQTVLQEVDIDSTNNLTSEAYALLRYNTEYLIEQLPAVPLVPDMEELIPSLTTPNNSGLTLSVKGANFTVNSVVYWNGTAKSTGYLSDSSLSIDINPGEVSSTGNIPVWVIEQVLSSDTLEFRIVNNLPESVEPVVECVRDNGDGSYTAYYGYSNNNNESVFIPVSSHNKISPSPWDRGQPGVFLIGRVENVFTVDFNRGNIIWHLNNRIAKANKKTESCP